MITQSDFKDLDIHQMNLNLPNGFQQFDYH